MMEKIFIYDLRFSHKTVHYTCCQTLCASDNKHYLCVCFLTPIENENNWCFAKDAQGNRYRLRMRQLTPTEYGRLMDVSDEDLRKMIDSGLSKTQLYKQFGNSIVVACMHGIFRNLFRNQSKSPLRVFEAFAGYGSQHMALERLHNENPQFSYEVVGISEIDKFAVQSYEAIHGPTRNFGDISAIDWESVPDFDLFTYSFPCTDISLAGRQKGLEENTGTRSSLLWQSRKAIIAKRPKYLLMENVKALTYKKFRPYLDKWIAELESYGYKNFWKVLNAKDFGVPQKRERVFMLSVLDKEAEFSFPEPQELKRTIKDCLESEVDASYFLSEDKVQKLFNDAAPEQLMRVGLLRIRHKGHDKPTTAADPLREHYLVARETRLLFRG